ncbi:hydroxyethylthiazole kinase [Mongoliitalea daihaiensis]|uniref:hydroxyethylthiazole kinase n=1 Tax=Mongoliitalea daihaiensis TaxID=2782006 RepID=UPI001F2897DD|nr:hydroxyethylthiazole kinase [Mongoliitalea daihaiensis]UJP66194.1 hydroxyethylthiazole kinase [Mongoliitalea daihaiensis]
MQQISALISNLKTQSPLVQSITNYVVMNNTANALLAAGASPIMAHAHSEVKDMLSIVGALVINIGTLDEYWYESMLMAAAHAHATQKPWVLDPVGAGATPYRNELLTELLAYKPNVIRGNASEIMSLASVNIQSKGVDSTNSSDEALDAGIQLSQQTGAVVVISGQVDYIIDGTRIAQVKNGNPMMAKVTGMGCTASALTGAMIALEKDYFLASTAAMVLMGIAGDIASEKAEGPGTLQLYFYDALYNLTAEMVEERMIVEYR